jgi:hypothetical protein
MRRLVFAIVAPLMLLAATAQAQEDLTPVEPPPAGAQPSFDPEPVQQTPQEPAPEPAPVQRPRPAPRRAPGAPGDNSPVVRADAENLGLFFRFGGLAGLTHSNTQVNVGPLLFNHVGMKYVFSEEWMLPMWFGTGVRIDSPSQGDSATNWGIGLGAGVEYHFRIWRRISPFFGGLFGLDMEDPTGESNLYFGVGLGPTLGVEYYIGDRLALTAMYMFMIQIMFQDGATSNTTFGLSTLAGGALNITYYF